MNQQKKMVYMQKIFNPSQYRSNVVPSNQENFARIMQESINKAINVDETPVKEKHVRRLLIGTHQIKSGEFFWQYVPLIRLQENQIVCWKFCYVLHKLIRDGHPKVLSNSYLHADVLTSCMNMWRHVKDGYGPLVHKYLKLLDHRIKFLVEAEIPPDLKINNDWMHGDNWLEQHGIRLFDKVCDVFLSIEHISELQELILTILDMKKCSSMTSTGQCFLAPLLVCIQDSSLLYDYAVKILFKLHSCLRPSDLEGHRSRFRDLHRGLRIFYMNTSNLQYFKTLLQIPQLPENPPNFLVASEQRQDVASQVVMIASFERDSPDQNSLISESSSQLLVDVGDEIVDGSTSRSNITDCLNSGPSDDELNRAFGGPSSMSSTISGSNADPAQSKIRELEDTIRELEGELVERTTQQTCREADIESTKRDLLKELNKAKIEHNHEVHRLEEEIGKLKKEVSNFKYQLSSTKKELEISQEESKRAKHENEISHEAMKRLVKDMSDLKVENAALKQRINVSSTQMSGTAKSSVDGADCIVVKKLNKQLEELRIQLSEHQRERQEWLRERDTLAAAKTRLEGQLNTNQEDLLMAEMNETDLIIREATKRIEELSENSRKNETGIKLQVNEKISEVCSNLMKAVRNLIVQSRLLQREIVGNEQVKNEEFYKRNSTWTDGLISAANVVAMAARSLVDSADRTMSGQAKYSELAAAAHEIATATTQLVVASRVKANKDSEKLKILGTAAKQVNQCTSNVVDTARVCGELIEQEVDKIDISSLSLHQTKKLEMETQVKLLELEDQLSKERIKLGLLRRQHYEQEEAQAADSTITGATQYM